jgi:hypothetical protein
VPAISSNAMNMRIAAIVLFIGIFHCAFGQTNTNALVAGDWSSPVADEGKTVRGRLWVGEGQYRTFSRASPSSAVKCWFHAPVYLELEHVYTFGWSKPIEIYFDIFSGLRFEVHDGSGKSIRPQHSSFTAELPEPYWVTLPCDATVRLRADVYNVGNPVVRFGLNSTNTTDLGNITDPGIWVGDGVWLIPPTSTNDYFLSCTFSPSATYHPSPLGYHVWQGTLKLPMVKIPVKKP